MEVEGAAIVEIGDGGGAAATAPPGDELDENGKFEDVTNFIDFLSFFLFFFDSYNNNINNSNCVY